MLKVEHKVEVLHKQTNQRTIIKDGQETIHFTQISHFDYKLCEVTETFDKMEVPKT